jgi:hypothetical protein
VNGVLMEAVQLDLASGQRVGGVIARGATPEGQHFELFVPACELPGRLSERPKEVAQAMRERLAQLQQASC